jgi:hypothetical protein
MARDFSEFLKSKGVDGSTGLVSVYQMMDWVKEWQNEPKTEMESTELCRCRYGSFMTSSHPCKKGCVKEVKR